MFLGLSREHRLSSTEMDEVLAKDRVTTTDLPTAASHPFYRRLNQLLREHGFDDFVEAQCAGFYAATMGRPGLPPGIYFRLLLIGYFEGIDSERGITWRAADSLALRDFLGLDLHDVPPDHSTISRTRRLIVVEEVVADKGYHSRTTVHDLETLEIRTYISEPDRGPQSWIESTRRT